MVSVFGISPSSVETESAGFNPVILQRIDTIAEKAIAAKKMPGCVVCIGRSNGIAFLKAYGNKKVVPKESPPVPMTSDTLFDLASLTKPIVTATSIMILIEQGKLKLDSPVAEYLTEFKTPEKQTITIRQLLLHTAGFIPDNDLADYQDGVEKATERLLALSPVKKSGTDFRYSDVSFQLLGILVERVSGFRLDEFSRNNLFEPLGMTETCFVPNAELSKKAAPTQDRELGQVHDPRAFRLGGVAGHAGLFSTAADLALFAKMLLNQGEIKGQSNVLKPETVQLTTTANTIPEGYRCLGWDMLTGYSGNRGKTMSPSAFGHGGFTGTSLWVDPALDLFVIFLSNRVHPDGKGSVNTLAGEIGTIAADAVSDLPLQTGRIDSVRKTMKHYQQLVPQNTVSKTTKTKNVLSGIDLLCKDRFAVLRGKRVGLITNHTGISH
ncbi:MAG: serine hydrolase, partial [Planctomycetaceae bacterium]|nr:serine hydrolase [Planctomycetaceae bacterium]